MLTWQNGPEGRAAPLGTGGPTQTIWAIAAKDQENYKIKSLYAGGAVDPSLGALQQYDSSSGWSSLHVTGGDVTAIECGSTQGCPEGVYIGGRFTSAGGVAVPGFAYYDSGTGAFSAVGGWTKLASGDHVSAIAVDTIAGFVYIGGQLSNVNGVNTIGVAAYNTATKAWEARAGSFNAPVIVLTLSDFGSTLYAGGSFQGPMGQGYGLAVMKKQPSPSPVPSPSPSTTPSSASIPSSSPTSAAPSASATAVPSASASGGASSSPSSTPSSSGAWRDATDVQAAAAAAAAAATLMLMGWTATAGRAQLRT